MNNNIKKIPFIWNYLPFFETKMASAIYPNIYFPENELMDLLSQSPSLWIQSVLLHEKVHLIEQEKMGIFKFGFFYHLSKKFRLEQELIAIKEQMKFLKENNAPYDIKRKAKQFSGKEYLYIMSFESAEKILTDLWESL